MKIDKIIKTSAFWILLLAVAIFLVLYSGGPMIGWFLAGLAIGAIGGTIFGVWIMMEEKNAFDLCLFGDGG